MALDSRRTAPRRRGGGHGRCKACNHPEQAALNAALAAGQPINTLARAYGMSWRALRAHKEHHLSPALVAIHTSGGVRTVIETMRDLFGRSLRVLETAELTGNAQQQLQAIKECRETALVIARATGELEPKPAVLNVLTDENWLRVQGAILKALSAHPTARLAVADALRRMRDRDD